MSTSNNNNKTPAPLISVIIRENYLALLIYAARITLVTRPMSCQRYPIEWPSKKKKTSCPELDILVNCFLFFNCVEAKRGDKIYFCHASENRFHVFHCNAIDYQGRTTAATTENAFLCCIPTFNILFQFLCLATLLYVCYIQKHSFVLCATHTYTQRFAFRTANQSFVCKEINSLERKI